MLHVFVVLAAILMVSATVAATYWPEILSWAHESLFPWIERNIPSITEKVRDAFVAADEVVVPVRRTIRNAWNKLREYLLKQTAEIKRKSSSAWVRRVTSWVIKVLETGESVPATVVTEEILTTDELPDDIRREWLHRGKAEAEINVTKLRDEELELGMST